MFSTCTWNPTTRHNKPLDTGNTNTDIWIKSLLFLCTFCLIFGLCFWLCRNVWECGTWQGPNVVLFAVSHSPCVADLPGLFSSSTRRKPRIFRMDWSCAMLQFLRLVNSLDSLRLPPVSDLMCMRLQGYLADGASHCGGWSDWCLNQQGMCGRLDVTADGIWGWNKKIEFSGIELYVECWCITFLGVVAALFSTLDRVFPPSLKTFS